MKKIIALIILVGIMSMTAGCGITHETKVNSSNVINNIEKISESNK